jgi:GntR family transcriptional regulator
MKTTNNSGDGVSRYLRLYRVLSQDLAEGRIAPGEALPSEPRLVREYGISRTTVRNALARLAAEGRIVRRRGSGTYASIGARRASPAQDLSRVLEDAQRLGSKTTVQRVAFARTSTPDFLLREWPQFGAAALLIRRLRRVRGEPVVLETSYVPAQIGARLNPGSLDGGSVLEALAACGHAASEWEREFDAMPADPITADSLGVAVGAPVLAVSTVARDSRGRILEYARFIYRPDRYEAHVSLARENRRRTRAAVRG